MKNRYIYIVYIAIISMAMLAGCRGAGSKKAEAAKIEQGVVEAAHDHSAEVGEHSHDGVPCTGHDSDADHNHEAPHDHSAEVGEHSHDGVPCTGHDSDADHNHEAEHNHSAEVGEHSHDGVACTGHDGEADHNHEAPHDHSAEAAHDHDHDHSALGDEDEIIFPVNQQSKIDFRVERVELGSFTDVIRAGGEILSAQGSHHSIVAPSSGIISFGGATLTEGGAVGASQRLFYISSSKVGSGDVLLRNKANYDKAKQAYERAEKLIEDRIISQKEFEEYRFTYQQAKIEYEALAGDGSSRGVAVNSPIGGYITSLNVIAGDYVEVGQVLGSVSQDSKLMLRAEASLKYLPRLSAITGANFITPYDNKTYQLAQMGGRLLSVSRGVAEGSALIPITFQFNNIGSIVAGSYVEVRLLGRTQSGVITLPLSAVTEQQGLYYVYVQLDAEGFVRREVELGTDDGMRVKIESGLKVGERVVTRGAINVKMASLSDAIPHSHEH